MKKGCQNFFQHPSFCRLLPKFQSLILRNEHLVARLHIEGLIPGIDMWQGSVDTPFARQNGLSLYAPIIVKYRDDKTAASVVLESILR